MSYLDERTASLVRVLDHATDLKAHRLSGYVANWDFWTGEVAALLQAIDGYPARAARTREATEGFLDDLSEKAKLGAAKSPTSTIPLCDCCSLADPGDTDLGVTPAHNADDLARLREKVVSSFRRFVKRAYKAGLVDPEPIREAEERLKVELV